MNPLRLLVVGVGGLGKCLVHEGQERGLQVSVFVRNREKLESDLDAATLSALSAIHLGDGTDAEVLDRALRNVDVVASGRGAAPDLARALSEAVKRNDTKKLCWPAGTTNVMADDGVTPNYKRLSYLGAWVEPTFRTHGACIELIRKTGINYVIFCPGRMAAAGRRSPGVEATIRINRDAGAFVSYEDAAWVILEGATTDKFDRQLVSAATPSLPL